MANVKQAILKAKIDGVIAELLVKSNIQNVYYDDNTTLATKLAEIISDVAKKADSTTVATDISTAINGLRQEMLGETPVEAYNTFTELAAYISEHEEVSDALTEAIGNKADKSVVEAIQATVDALGEVSTLDKISEDYLTDELKEKINAASEGNHGHLNKGVLDGITAEKVSAWDSAEQNAKDYADGLNTAMDTRMKAVEANEHHNHANKDVLDDITATKVSAWDAAEQNAKTYADGLAGNYDSKGSAAAAESAAKAYADSLAGNYDAKGSAADALSEAKSYADGLNTTMSGRMTEVEGKAHEHANKAVLDGISADLVSAWNGKANIYYSATNPAGLTENDLWVQIVE